MPDRDERVDAALAEYLAACDAGDPPQRAAFLARFPGLADSLSAFLDDHERMRRAADLDRTGGQSPAQQPSESFDADEYNSVQSPNDNSAPTGYYGTGNSGPPSRTPAEPGGGHQPAR